MVGSQIDAKRDCATAHFNLIRLLKQIPDSSTQEGGSGLEAAGHHPHHRSCCLLPTNPDIALHAGTRFLL